MTRNFALAERSPTRRAAKGPGMGWSRFWLNQAGRAAARRRRRYEIEPPPAIRKALEPEAGPVGFLDSIRLGQYVFFGTLRGFFTLTWRFLSDLDTPEEEPRSGRWPRI